MIEHIDFIPEDAIVSYKDQEYQYMGTCKMKCPETGDWKVAIQYFDMGREGITYVREANDFYNKFTVVR